MQRVPLRPPRCPWGWLHIRHSHLTGLTFQIKPLSPSKGVAHLYGAVQERS